MDNVRILVIDQYLKAVNRKFHKEVVLWNIATCLAKGRTAEQASIHASSCQRRAYLRLAQKRFKKMASWAEKHPKETAEICAPYLREYARRAAERLARAS